MPEETTRPHEVTHATVDQVHSAVRNLEKSGNVPPRDAAVWGLVNELASAVETLNTEAGVLEARVKKLEDERPPAPPAGATA